MEFDIVPLIAPLVTINTPDGPVTRRADMSPILYRRILAQLMAYNDALTAAEGEPEWDSLFRLAAEASGIPEEKLREWGKVASIKMLDFLASRHAALLEILESRNSTNGTTPSPPPSASPRRSAAPSR